MSFFINNKKHFVFILLFLISEVAFSPVWNHKRDVVELHLDPDCSNWTSYISLSECVLGEVSSVFCFQEGVWSLSQSRLKRISGDECSSWVSSPQWDLRLCRFVLEHSSPCRSWTGILFPGYFPVMERFPCHHLCWRWQSWEVFWQQRRVRLSVMTPKLPLNSVERFLCGVWWWREEVEKVITLCQLPRGKSGGCKCLSGSRNRGVQAQVSLL